MERSRLEACCRSQKEGVSVAFFNANRALKWAREGRYGNALHSLGSLVVAAPSDATALLEFQNRHPQHSLPAVVEDLPSPITVESDQVLLALRSFPQVSSPAGSHLRVQHLLDAISGSPCCSAVFIGAYQMDEPLAVWPTPQFSLTLAGWSPIDCSPEEGQWCPPHSSRRGVSPPGQPPLLCGS